MTARGTIRDRMERRYLPILVVLFIGSGCAALIYEIVWFQILELVIGSSSISLGILLGTFMGGMCLGSLVAPRLIARTQHLLDPPPRPSATPPGQEGQDFARCYCWSFRRLVTRAYSDITGFELFAT